MKTIINVLFLFSIVNAATAQVPLLNSYPSAKATLFLDFDGHTVAGTSWNWAGPIEAKPSGFNASQIKEMFERVAEDYRIFNINVTTDSTMYWAAPVFQRQRVIVTPTCEWYTGVGGISFVGSFRFGDDTPCFVFPPRLSNNTKYVAEAISHEAGHTLGLQHQSVYTEDCHKTEYNPGTGDDHSQISWAPIMGLGYYKNTTTWYYGTSKVGCNRYQDDIAVIAGAANNFGLRDDDISDYYVEAAPLTLTGTDFSGSGLINNADDKDVFKFTLGTSTNVRLNAVPQHVGANNSGANLDISLSLLNHQGDTLGKYNPAELLNASLDSNLNSGTYYIVIEGTGNDYLQKEHSVGYYSISGSIGVILPVHRITLSGAINSDMHTLNWTYEADEAVKAIELQQSKDGIHFEAVTRVHAGERSFAWKPFNSSDLFYRIRVITVADERSYYSNIIRLRDNGRDNYSPVKVMHNVVNNYIAVNTNQDYVYQLLDATGRMLQQGKLVTGANRIDVYSAPKGLLILRVQDGSASYTMKLMKQ
jgi:hypothetical protein